MNKQPNTDDTRDEIDPIEFVRRALAISPDDARQVREDAAKRERRRNDGHEDDTSSG